MGNLYNLVSPVRTTSEARKRGRNGGVKSGEARRRRKALREAYTKEVAFDELDNLMKEALNSGNLNSAVKIAELKGKMCGYYVDKVAQTNSSGEDVVVPVINIVPAPIQGSIDEGNSPASESVVSADKEESV